MMGSGVDFIHCLDSNLGPDRPTPRVTELVLRNTEKLSSRVVCVLNVNRLLYL